VCDRASMTKLYLRIEHTGTGTNAPSYQGFCNFACFQCFAYFIFFDTTNFSSLYNLLCKILSIIPPVLPILKQPGFTPPTVAGPIIVTFFCCAARIIFLVIFSGIPSAIMAIVLICGNCNVSIMCMAVRYLVRMVEESSLLRILELLDQELFRLIFLKSFNNAFKCCSYICKISNSSSYNKYFSIRTLYLCHQTQYATMVHIQPSGLRIVNFKLAPDLASKSAI
ncbi:hypothetical protein ALC53_04537, partial [Atta colombica]